MKRASYREAIRWVADHDSAGDDDSRDPEVVQELITSVLVADIFDVPLERVGRDVVRARKQQDKRDRIAASERRMAGIRSGELRPDGTPRSP